MVSILPKTATPLRRGAAQRINIQMETSCGYYITKNIATRDFSTLLPTAKGGKLNDGM